MSRLKELKDYVCLEYHNLSQNINRPRTRAAVASRKKTLSEAISEFTNIIEGYENSKVPSEHWNRLTDQYTLVHSKALLALRILDNSAIVPEGNRSRLLSENCLEFVTSELSEEELNDLERSAGFNELPFSSTIVETNGAEGGKEFEKDKNRSSLLEQLERLEEEFVKESERINAINTQSTRSFEQHVKNIIHNTKRNMAEFPVDRAIQCIPEFRGSSDELEAFLFHIQHFADLIPAGGPQDQLVYVVLMKLKGKAAAALHRIRARTWAEVKENLLSEFGTSESIESVIKKIEGLRQGPSEEFAAYKKRTLAMRDSLYAYEEAGGIAAMEKSLRMHFIGGLNNVNLKQMACGKQDLSLQGLMAWLEKRTEECDQLEDIEKKMRGLDLLERQHETGRRRWQAGGGNNNEQRRDAEARSGNRSPARNYNNSYSNNRGQNSFARGGNGGFPAQQANGGSSNFNRGNHNNNNNYNRNRNYNNDNYNNNNYNRNNSYRNDNYNNSRDNNNVNNNGYNERQRGANADRYQGPPSGGRFDGSQGRGQQNGPSNQGSGGGRFDNARRTPPWNGLVYRSESQDWRNDQDRSGYSEPRYGRDNGNNGNRRSSYDDRRYDRYDDGQDDGNSRGRSPGRRPYNSGNDGRYEESYMCQPMRQGYRDPKN